MQWMVTAHTRAPAGSIADVVPSGVVEQFRELLSRYSPVVRVARNAWRVTVTVDAESPTTAIAEGYDVILEGGLSSDMPRWPFVHLEATVADEHPRRLQEAGLPELVGTTEVLALLGIPRQRLHELRCAGRFPDPLVKLAATPVWLRSAIVAFDSMRDRRPGRTLQWFDEVFKDGSSVTAVLAKRADDHPVLATIGIVRDGNESTPDTFTGAYDTAHAVALALGMSDPPETISNGTKRWTRPSQQPQVEYLDH